jgi:hypothetical protein
MAGCKAGLCFPLLRFGLIFWSGIGGRCLGGYTSLRRLLPGRSGELGIVWSSDVGEALEVVGLGVGGLCAE